MFDLLWNGGNGLVKRATIVGDIEDGGLKMVDVKSMFKALRVKWKKRYRVLFCYSPPPPHQKMYFNSEGKKKADCLIVKERKTFTPGMHISIVKDANGCGVNATGTWTHLI